MTKLLLDRREAAALMGVSVRSFDRHIRPALPIVQVGGLPRWILADLTAWADRAKDGCSDSDQDGRSPSPGPSKARARSSGSGPTIAERLNELHAARTRSPSRESSSASGSHVERAQAARQPRRSGAHG